MIIRFSTRIAFVAAISGVLQFAAVALSNAAPSSMDVDPWVAEHLSADEIASVQRLAEQIVRLDPRAADADREQVQRQAVALSIRESAALGVFLSGEDGLDPAPWIALAAERERRARERLEELLARFAPVEADYPRLQTTVRGPEWLRQACGEELLTEVTGVGFWQFWDGAIPAPSDLSDADVMVLLALPGLECVWAEFSKLSDAGVEQLATLPRMREYHLAGCTVLTDASLRAVAKPDLKLLDVSAAAQVTDEGIAHLGNCPHIEELHLRETGVTSAALTTVAELHALRGLTLSKTAVREGLDRLRTLDKLERLGLTSLGSAAEPVPVESLGFLSDLKRLTWLGLEGTAIRRVELRGLSELEFVSLGHPSLKEISLVDLPRIVSLETGYPQTRRDIHLESVEVEGLTAIKHLRLHCPSAAACDGLADGLATLPSLKDLYLLDAAMTGRLAAAIGQHPALEHLELDAFGISDEQLNAILDAPLLEHLSCDAAQLTDDGLLAFAHRDRLKSLMLTGLRHDDASRLVEARSLERLSLWDCEIGKLTLADHPSLSSFEATLGGIGQLRLEGCPALASLRLSDVAVEQLNVQSCAALPNLFAGGAKLGTVVLSDLPELTRVTIHGRASVDELRLTELPALRSFTFWAADLTAKPLEALLEIPTLTGLDVSGTRLGDDAAAIIGRMHGLEILSASSQFTRDGLKHLQQLKNLRRLDLHCHDDADWTKEEARQMFSGVPEFVVFGD